MAFIFEYPESHQEGYIFIEQDLKRGVIEGDLGIQISPNGRVWICINGKAAIRFNGNILKYRKENNNESRSDDSSRD